jgi:hypothetical protein
MDEVWPYLAGEHIGHSRPEFLERLAHFHQANSFFPFPPHGSMLGKFVGEPIPVSVVEGQQSERHAS